MPKLILHAGMPKTGTSTIQRTLSSSAWDGILESRNIRCLKRPSTMGNQSVYLHALLKQPYWLDEVEHQQNVDKLVKALDTIRRAVKPDTAILVSAESVSEIARNTSDLQRVKDLFSGFFSDIAVIQYVREPLEYFCSRTQQSLKSGYPLPTSIRNAITLTDFTDIIENLRALFGQSNVHIRSYDAALLTGGDVLTDFCVNALGIPDGPELQRLISNTSNRNYSLSQELIDLLVRLYKARAVSPRNCCANFLHAISDIPWAGARFGPAFLAGKDRDRLLAAADTAREQMRSYLGYDCFPSYKTTDRCAHRCRTVQDETTASRRNIAFLQTAVDQVEEQLGTTGSGPTTGMNANVQTSNQDQHQEILYQLLDRLYGLCESVR